MTLNPKKKSQLVREKKT